MGADAGEKVGNLVGFLEVEQRVSAALCFLRLQVHLQQHRAKLPAHTVVTGGELQMKALLRIGHASTGQESALDKGFTAAGVFQDPEVDVVGDGAAGVAAEALEDSGDFFRILDTEAALSYRVLGRKLIKTEGEGLLEQAGKPLGKGSGGRDNTDLGGTEGVTVEQDSVALGKSQIALFKAAVAEFCFGFGGKGHGGLLICRYPG